MIFNKSISLTTFLLSFFILLTGCSGIAEISHLVKMEKFSDAKNAVKGNNKDENILAALLLADYMKSEESRSRDLIFKIYSCKSTKKILKHIKSEHDKPSSIIANLVLNQKKGTRHYSINKYILSDYSDVRATAATLFASNLPHDLLVEMTTDINPVVRGAAVAAICQKKKHQWDDAADFLIKDPALNVRIAAAYCEEHLLNSADQSILFLRDRIIFEDNLNVKLAFARAISHINSPLSQEVLLALITGPLDEFKIKTAALLLDLKNKTAKNRIIDGLTDNNIKIRALSMEQAANKGLLSPESILESATESDTLISLTAAKILLNQEKYKKDAVKILTKIWKDNTQESSSALYYLLQYGDENAVGFVRDEFNKIDKNSENSLFEFIKTHQNIKELRDLFISTIDSRFKSVRVLSAESVINICSINH